jgi:hypothetical protein
MSTIPTAIKGLDASERITSIATCIKNAGFAFAIRYYNIKNSKQLPTKRLILSEAQALVKAGLQLGVVFQQGGRDPASFNHATGVQHGAAAHGRANEIGQPAGSAIYFSVDFDAAPALVAKGIKDYFKGVREGLLPQPTEATRGTRSAFMARVWFVASYWKQAW